jgi:hypothetical protein
MRDDHKDLHREDLPPDEEAAQGVTGGASAPAKTLDRSDLGATTTLTGTPDRKSQKAH